MLAAGSLLILAGAWPLAAQEASFYKAIPPGFDFPADEKTLLAARDQQDVTAMRRHAWMVFAGVTQPAQPNQPDSEAIWETWYRGDQVFAAGPQLQGPHQLLRRFTAPRQFRQKGHATPQDAGLSLASFTLFNQETKDHIRKHNYHLAATLEALNASFPAGGDPARRKIKDFDRAAMSIKAVWWPVKATGRTALPVWDPEKQQLQDPAPAQRPETWKRVVAIDPTRELIPAGEVAAVTLEGRPFPRSRVVPLRAFYHFKITTAAQVQALALSNFNVQVGDALALVAFHYTTKEIPDWVWATFWWHDAPDKGPYAADRVAPTLLKGPWRNYLMDVAYDMTTPKEPDGKPNAAFNPWLEANFNNGVNSNCMTCHQQATWRNSSFLPVTRGPKAANDPLFQNATKLDFVWAFMMEGPGTQLP